MAEKNLYSNQDDYYSLANNPPNYGDWGHQNKYQHQHEHPHHQHTDFDDDGIQVEMPVEIPTKDMQVAPSTSGRDTTCAAAFQRCAGGLCRRHSKGIVRLVLLCVFVCYTVYFALAIKYSLDGAITLITVTCITVFLSGYVYIRDHYGARIYSSVFQPVGSWIVREWPILKWFVLPLIFIAIILYVTLGLVHEFQQLQSVSGMVIFIFLVYLFSKFPSQVRWRPVIFGFALQFVMGILVLRTTWGFVAVKWLSNQITEFINYAMEGASIVFGNPTMLLHPFVFTIMPMLIYIGAVMSILYYLGITQLLAAKIGWFVQVTMGTTAIESLGVGANIFLNGMDTMLMLRFYLDKLTPSEFHCFLVGNHSTVAGFAFATFVMFGAPPQHLLSAAVMSAPAAIAICKLSFPETEESVTKTQADVTLEKGEETNVIEAGANGAAVAGTTVFAVVVNYIGFMSILAFVNATLSYIGGRVGFPQLSFEFMCSYLFFPIAMLMGVTLSECQEVAKLVGLKVFTSEILAYQELGVSISNGLVSARSASITTYALCGFSSLSTLAIAVGVWNSLCPAKTQEMASQLARVIINANLSCFLTACVAGLMYDPSMETITPDNSLINQILDLIPDYKIIWDLLPSI